MASPVEVSNSSLSVMLDTDSIFAVVLNTLLTAISTSVELTATQKFEVPCLLAIVGATLASCLINGRRSIFVEILISMNTSCPPYPSASLNEYKARSKAICAKPLWSLPRTKSAASINARNSLEGALQQLESNDCESLCVATTRDKRDQIVTGLVKNDFDDLTSTLSTGQSRSQ